MKLRHAFTMLELVFVIAILGVIGVIGAKILRSTYDAFTSSSINNHLHIETELALKQIANRLQYRFKDSIIARNGAGGFTGLASATGNAQVIEWVGYDIDGWEGVWNGTYQAPTWSGFIDVDTGNANAIVTPGTDTANINSVIQAVCAANGSPTAIEDSAIFFTGANTNVQTDYGWNGVAITTQTTAAHPINLLGTSSFQSSNAADFTNVDVYEQYKLAWTAYALELTDNDGDGKQDDLILHYDYQPWAGGTYQNANGQALLMENVVSFQFQAVGDIVKVQLCIDNNATDNIPISQYYALCKEKVVF